MRSAPVAVAALKLSLTSVAGRIARWEAILPVVARVIIGFTYRYDVDLNATGSTPCNSLVAFIWVLLGVAIVLGFPVVARRVGTGLAASDGLTVGSETPPEPPQAPASDGILAR